MGTKMAPAFANLFMGDFESKALDGFPDKPFLWWRYIDDFFMIWTLGEDELGEFINYLNSIHQTIKITSERSTTSIPFLDVTIQLNNGKIKPDLYCKPTDKHQYLLSTSSQLSSHPHHTKRSITYSLALRLRRICSTEHCFNKDSKNVGLSGKKRLQTGLTRSLKEYDRKTQSERIPLASHI